MSSEQTNQRNDLSEIIAESFGANATYVETLLARFRSDPALVDESWRTYFEELIGETLETTKRVTLPPADGARAAAPKGDGHRGTGVAPAKAEPARPAKTEEGPTEPATQAIPIRGAALKIVENMEA